MLRSIGSVTVLALFMVGCGGGSSDSSPQATLPRPPTKRVYGRRHGIGAGGLRVSARNLQI